MSIPTIRDWGIADRFIDARARIRGPWIREAALDDVLAL
jgi:hypothetical protein